MRVNQNWLTIHTPLVRDSIRKVKEKTIQGMRSIRHSYFRPQSLLSVGECVYNALFYRMGRVSI